MSVVQEVSYLTPSPFFFLELLVATLLFVLLVVWPLVGAARRRQPAWIVAIVLLGPIGGILWFALGSKEPRQTLVAN